MIRSTMTIGFAVATVVSAFLAGCSPYVDSRVPEPIRPVAEPEFGRKYLLYRPSGYDKRLTWPLIVVCHGAFPDNPNRQIRAWTELAESEGFVVLAPSLTATRRTLRSNAVTSLARQRGDEQCILAAVNHVRGAYNISDDRVFIYGWSHGAVAALHTGLRNPDIFRAISMAQPNIDTAMLTDADNDVDPHQPIQVRFAVSDAISGRHGRTCLDWLYTLGVDVREDSTGPVRKTDGAQTITFLESVIRNEPWVFIRAFPSGSGNPLEYQFKLHSTVEPLQYRWAFGDGGESPISQPVHAYADGGMYDVKVSVADNDGFVYSRSISVRVP